MSGHWTNTSAGSSSKSIEGARTHVIPIANASTRSGQLQSGNFTGTKVAFSWEIERSPNFLARSITTDTGWKISLDRGLDIFQRFETGLLSVEQNIQETRLSKGFEVTYLREAKSV